MTSPTRHGEDDGWALFPHPEQSLLCCGFVALCLIVGLALLAGCAVDPAYVEADRLTFEAIAPEYSSLVSEAGMTEDQVERRLRLIRSWEARIVRAEEGQ